MPYYGIDCSTKEVKKIKCWLLNLKSTFFVEDKGAYWLDTSITLLHLYSTLSERELENKLWKKGFDYIGVFSSDEKGYPI